MMFACKLRNKVNFAILVTFALIAVLFSSIQLPFQQRRLQTVTKKVRTVLQTLVERDREHLANEIYESSIQFSAEYNVKNRFQSVKMRLQQMKAVEGIVSISIFNTSGKLMTSEGSQISPADLSLKEQEAATKGILMCQERFQGQRMIRYMQEIQAIGEKLGYIQIYYSLADVEHEQRLSFLIFGGLLGAILLIMLVVLNLILSKTIIHPITYLRDGMQRIQTGKLGGQVIVTQQDEIGDLSKAFNAMSSDLAVSYTQIESQNAELMRLDKLKDEFLANTSHELRTPLTGIIGIAESLIDGAAGNLSPQMRQNLQMITNSGRRLSCLVNSILDFSRMRQNVLCINQKPLYIASYAQIVIDLLDPLALQKSIQLTNEISKELPAVLADEDRLIQILQNLIGNAIKFTDHGTVRIRAFPRNEEILISVVDTGIGIPDESLKRIFESFEQADGSTEREYGGTGLGLSITKSLVKLHGGNIGVQSTPGQGSTFTFSLPISKEQPDPTEFKPMTELSKVYDTQPETASPAFFKPLHSDMGGSTTILVVDDEPVNLRVIQNQLSLVHYEIASAPNGQLALEWIEQHGNPDLILLDVMMPKMSGYEVCKKIRRAYSSNELPVIMMTAKNQVSNLVEGFNAGANDYIAKPFSRDELLVRINSHLQLSSVSNDLANAKRRMEVLLETTKEVVSVREKLTAMLQAANSILMEIEFDYCAFVHIYLKDTEKKVMYAAYHIKTGLSPDNKPYLNLKNVLNTYPEYVHELPESINPDPLDSGMQSAYVKDEHLIVPIIDKDLFLGILALNGRIKKRFSTEEKNFIDTLSQSLAISLENIDFSNQILQNNQQLDFLNKELETHIRDLNRTQEELTTAKEKAEAASLAKTQFLSNVSHELKTPMNAILGISQVALRKERSPERQNDLNTIIASAKSLTAIINTILDFSEMEAGRIQLDQVDFFLEDILNALNTKVHRNAREKGLEYIIDISDDVPNALFGDSKKLEQVLNQFMSNAVKFTDAGHVRLFVNVVPAMESERKVTLRFTIQDTGIGISEEQRENLFQSFTQVDGSYTRTHDGLGLGLALCEKLVNLLGGGISVESETGKGSVFAFTAIFVRQTPENEKIINLKQPEVLMPGERLNNLKASPGTSREIEKFDNNVEVNAETGRLNEESEEIKGLENIRGAKILLAEDNSINQQVVCELLESQGLLVTVAENGKAAIASLYSDKPFDAVMMDIRMPEMDGIEATQTIRKDDRYKALPIIAMTAQNTKEEKRRCLDAGMNDHLSKPINPQSFFSTLVKWIPPLENLQVVNTQEKVEQHDAEINLPPHFPGLDLESGLEKIGGNKKLYKKVLSDFSKDYANFSDILTNAYQDKQTDDMKRMVHALKGVSGNIGAGDLYEIVKEVDGDLKNNRLDKLDVKLKRLGETIQTLLDSIHQLTQSDSPSAANNNNKTKDINALMHALAQIDDMLSQAYPESEDLFDSIKNDLIDLGFEEETQKAAEYIEDFEYKAARKIVALIKKTIIKQIK